MEECPDCSGPITPLYERNRAGSSTVIVWCDRTGQAKSIPKPSMPENGVEQTIRDAIESQIDEHGLETVFWALDSVYDEYDERMIEQKKTEIPVVEANVIVQSDTDVCGKEFEQRRIESERAVEAARQRLLDDPTVLQIDTIETVDTNTILESKVSADDDGA